MISEAHHHQDQSEITTMMWPDQEEETFSPGQESEGDYYQMAFIFQLGLPPISRRLTWDVYWTMHRQIANACGIGNR